MKKGDVCIVKLDVGAGHEQYGERPAVLISNIKMGIVVVVPLTTNLEALKFPYILTLLPNKNNKLTQESVALIFHIRSIDKSRIIKTIGKIDNVNQRKLDKILKEMLSL